MEQQALTAARIHEAKLLSDVIESQLVELIMKLHADRAGECEEITTDHYDNSIEIYGQTPSDEVRDGMFAIGFDRVWQHPHGYPRDASCQCPLQSRPR
jgi:hypothetical protein